MKVSYRIKIRSRHPSHSVLRKNLPKLGFTSIVRLGSTTELLDKSKVELNSIESIRTSSNKLLMKEAFTKHNVKTADWFKLIDINKEELPFEYPIVIKNIYGSRNTGNHFISNREELDSFLSKSINLNNYIVEKYYNYNKEYRLHVNKHTCFYTCRKMLKTDAKNRWFRNDSNSIWVLEENELFDRPANWNEIVNECIKALNAVGLDFGAIDLRVQSNKDKKENIRQNPDFIVIETNSAPSFGNITQQKYLEEIPKMLINKYNNR